ncbi:MAG TPA: cysteine--tRNA ligase [Candidatus Saccharimonas sp.]|nr:cysteine--tRNA ligase [Candidatus Saccharimonas sp.]
MRLHNTLTRQTEELKPIKPGEVSLYTCGFTVYDYAHIGNAFAYLAWDNLRRALELSGYKVRHVMNITDVGHLVSDADEGEDKLEKGAKRAGKTVWDIAEHYTEAFKQDMLALNILPPNAYTDPKRHDHYARATDFIPQQIELVQRLFDHGFVYQTEQAIYFDVTKLPSYGELSGQKLTDKEVAVRDEVVSDPSKHHPYDFAVWFFTVGHYADHTMHWPSPWGEGFPGWHLECSAIIHATLNDPIDIHTGGIDHIGTHHTNEMAQTEAAFGHRLANNWLHNNFMLVDGGKMSKSKQNFYTLRALTDKGIIPLAYRLLVLQSHYRTPLNFTWESLEAAQNTLLNLHAWADQTHQGESGGLPAGWDQPVITALANDLDTATGLAHVFELSSQHTPTQADLKQLDNIFGLSLANRSDITAAQKRLIADREAARVAKDWAKSDALRDTLRQEHQLDIDDTPAGPRWRRTAI